MAKHRVGRLSEEIKKSISKFLINGAKDPRLTSRIISISGVDVTNDGSYATVFISPLCLADEDREKVYGDVLAGFNKAKGMLRSQLARDLKIRHTPELIFKLDSSIDYGMKIDSIIDEINAQPKSVQTAEQADQAPGQDEQSVEQADQAPGQDEQKDKQTDQAENNGQGPDC